MSKGTQPRTVRIGDDLWRDANELAEQRGETVSELIRRLLADEVESALSGDRTRGGNLIATARPGRHSPAPGCCAPACRGRGAQHGQEWDQAALPTNTFTAPV